MSQARGGVIHYVYVVMVCAVVLLPDIAPMILVTLFEAICLAISEIHATHVWYATIELILLVD